MDHTAKESHWHYTFQKHTSLNSYGHRPQFTPGKTIPLDPSEALLPQVWTLRGTHLCSTHSTNSNLCSHQYLYLPQSKRIPGGKTRRSWRSLCPAPSLSEVKAEHKEGHVLPDFAEQVSSQAGTRQDLGWQPGSRVDFVVSALKIYIPQSPQLSCFSYFQFLPQS